MTAAAEGAPRLRIAVYPGSFDPVTRGHEDLIRRSLAFVDRVIVGVAVNVAKQPLFTLEERVGLLRDTVRHPGVEVQSFDGLLVEFARRVGAAVIVRGLRAVSDFEYEFQMALMNRTLDPKLETVFLVPAFDLTYLSSSLVREVARFGGDVSQLVQPVVQQALRNKFGR
jgi:pantetheine-phosphate adenylyltransferase